ncbi:STAS domain-containing protein [Agarilytica rhodophyticola]|uniref:STAS domain-containing protein n=1 Tax=Agarilytica rhodophyticola TaxID=1737490 RepID=UPI000B34213E|nr:STAS domain-containing protein [Agarilytica rhodophyticola]
MTSGSIKIADHDGVFVIKMIGDVRLTLCLSFDEFIEQLLSRPDYTSVIFDLTQAQAIDSTTLGLMAKFSIKAGQHNKESPIVISNNPSISRILVSMSFDDIFRLVDEDNFVKDDSKSDEKITIMENNGSESEIKVKVLEAHRFLMGLNDENHAQFKELVETLEAPK